MDRPSVHTWSTWSGTVFETIMTRKAPIPKKMRSVWDSFLECLFTLDPNDMARFLRRLWPGKLRFQKDTSVWDSFLECSVPIWTDCSADWPVFETESRYHSLGLEARFPLPNENKYGAYPVRYSVNSSTLDWSGLIRYGSISPINVHTVSGRFPNWPKNHSVWT